MSRAGRLLQLLELLRGYRYPVQGQVLADELGISLRTFYRDIATLQQQGACIEGEAGVGYVLKPGFTLPPLVFSAEELEALVLGMRWVASQGDSGLQNAARQAESRIRAVLPAGLLDHMESNGLLVVPNVSLPEHQVDIQKLREAMRAEKRVDLTYADANGVPSQRRIWPFALGYFERVRVLVAWCELRGDFRHFRTDRIQSWRGLDEQYPLRRRELLRRWRLTLPGSARQS